MLLTIVENVVFFFGRILAKLFLVPVDRVQENVVAIGLEVLPGPRVTLDRLGLWLATSPSISLFIFVLFWRGCLFYQMRVIESLLLCFKNSWCHMMISLCHIYLWWYLYDVIFCQGDVIILEIRSKHYPDQLDVPQRHCHKSSAPLSRVPAQSHLASWFVTTRPRCPHSYTRNPQLPVLDREIAPVNLGHEEKRHNLCRNRAPSPQARRRRRFSSYLSKFSSCDAAHRTRRPQSTLPTRL